MLTSITKYSLLTIIYVPITQYLIVGKKMAKSRNLPGVTKSLMWVRLGGVEGSQENCIELLDSPGIIPARQLDQEGSETAAIQHCTTSSSCCYVS